MLKRFEFGGFMLDFVLSKYWMKLDGEEWSLEGREALAQLATLIAREPSGERQAVMVQALTSIVVKPVAEPIVEPSVQFLGVISEVEKGQTPSFYEVVGLRALKKVTEISRDYNDTYPAVENVWEILLQERVEEPKEWQVLQKQVLRLTTSHGMCGSGYCSATWSSETLKRVEDLGPMTHTPKEPMTVQLVPNSLQDTFSNEVFGWSGDGGCGYYPSGSAWVKMEHFVSTGRGFHKPLVHVLCGASGSGKSTLGRAVGRTAYETDKSETFLPEMAYADVIVLGGKHGHSVPGVREFFEKLELDVELVPVIFGSVGVEV